jgi:hypothetical protein
VEGASAYFVKLFRDGRGAQLVDWHRAVHQTLVATDAPWTVPNARAYLPDAQMLVFDAVDDATKVRKLLRPSLKDEQSMTTLLRHVAAAAQGLAAFQGCRLNALPSETPAEIVAAFRRAAAGIDAVAPRLARIAANALDLLDDTAHRLPPEPLVPAHGAFRHDQLLETGGRLVVLDLDTICLSGASADAGNFLGYLDLTAHRRPRLQPVIDDCANTFGETLLAMGFASPQWTSWYRAAAHVKKSLRSFFSLQPQWPETTARMIALAQSTLRETAAA